jgi:hypothetical protein
MAHEYCRRGVAASELPAWPGFQSSVAKVKRWLPSQAASALQRGERSKVWVVQCVAQCSPPLSGADITVYPVAWWNLAQDRGGQALGHYLSEPGYLFADAHVALPRYGKDAEHPALGPYTVQAIGRLKAHCL